MTHFFNLTQFRAQVINSSSSSSSSSNRPYLYEVEEGITSFMGLIQELGESSMEGIIRGGLGHFTG